MAWSNMTLPEAYSLLELRADMKLTPEVVRKAYHKQAKEHHPDVGPGTERIERERRMALVNEAKEILDKIVSMGRGAGVNPFGVMAERGDLESKFQREVVEAWEGIGALILNVHGHEYQKAGWPDLQIYSVPWTGQLELKVGDNPPSELQRVVLRDLRMRGTMAWVLRLREGYVYLEDEKDRRMGMLDKGVWKRWLVAERGRGILAMVKGAG